MPRKILPLGFVTPMQPVLVDTAPEGGTWHHEIKFDGYRTLAVIADGKARLFTRNANDWTAKYERVATALTKLKAKSFTLDGEMIVQDAEGRSSFSALRSAITRAPERLVLYAFDLLTINGEDIRRRPLIERRARLEKLIGPHDPNRPVQFSTAFVGDGPNVFAAAEKSGLEGIVSKRPDSIYTSGPTRDWLKVKCFTVADFEIVGVKTGSSGIPSAIMVDAEGKHVGDAMISLGGKNRETFWQAIDHLEPPRTRLAGFLKKRGTRFVKAGLYAKVKHLRGEEKLRHATILDVSLRE